MHGTSSPPCTRSLLLDASDRATSQNLPKYCRELPNLMWPDLYFYCQGPIACSISANNVHTKKRAGHTRLRTSFVAKWPMTVWSMSPVEQISCGDCVSCLHESSLSNTGAKIDRNLIHLKIFTYTVCEIIQLRKCF